MDTTRGAVKDEVCFGLFTMCLPLNPILIIITETGTSSYPQLGEFFMMFNLIRVSFSSPAWSRSYYV